MPALFDKKYFKKQQAALLLREKNFIGSWSGL